MSDLVRAIDNIRSYLDSGASVASDRLKENAQLYADACRKVNERLADCGGLLAQGLRPEALHLASLEPPLLDQLSILDFPGADRWAEIASSCGVQTPLLQVKFAQHLNQAYAEDRPLVELMKQHRRLALMKGDLMERISTMRKIADLDRSNLFWDEDLRILEKARLGELREDFEKAKKDQDLERINDIFNEVLSLEWREVPPADFVKRVEVAKGKVDQHKLREEFEAFEAALIQSLNGNNFQAAKALRTQIQTHMRANRVNDQDPMLRTIPQMFSRMAQEEKRIEQERKYESSLRELKQILMQPEPDLNELRMQFKKVSDFGYDIPHGIEDDYLACEYRDEQRKRRKKITQVGGLIVALLLTGLGIYFWVDRTARMRRVDEAVFRFTDLVSSKKYDLAREAYNDDSSKFGRNYAENTNVTTALLDLTAFEKIEDDRKMRARKVIEEARRVGYTDLNFNDVIENALKSNYLTNEDRAFLEKRKKDFIEFQQNRGSEINQKFDSELTELERKERDFVRDVGDPVKEATTKSLLEDLKSGCTGMGRRLSDLTDNALKDRYAVLKTKVDEAGKLLAAATAERRVVTAFDTIFSLEFNPASLQRSLEAEARTAVSDSQRAKDFTKVATERNVWDAVLEWNRFLKAAGDLSQESGPNISMTERVGAMSAFMKSTKSFLESKQEILPRPEINRYDAYLQGYGNRTKYADAFRSALNRRDCEDLYAIRLKDGKIYYMTKDPNPEITKVRDRNGSIVRLPVIKTADDLRQGAIPKDESISLVLIDGMAVVAPQVDLVASLRTQLKNMQATNWDRAMLLMLTQIAAAKEVEPVLRADLAYVLIDQIDKGNPLLGKLLLKSRDQLRRVDRLFTWINPTDEGKDVRKNAREALEGIPSVETLMRQLVTEREELARTLMDCMHPVIGWVYREPQGKEKSRTPGAVLKDGYAYVVVEPNGQPPRWVNIGRIANGKLIDTLPNEARVEGRPIFYSKGQISIR